MSELANTDGVTTLSLVLDGQAIIAIRAAQPNFREPKSRLSMLRVTWRWQRGLIRITFGKWKN
jgi:hypothetical protein